MAAGVASMGKKRKAASKGSEAPASVIVSIRVSSEYRDWLNRLAEFERVNLSDLLDRAITRYARDVQFKEVAPKR
jgi:uncharacterized protein (DUF1778 family)